MDRRLRGGSLLLESSLSCFLAILLSSPGQKPVGLPFIHAHLHSTHTCWTPAVRHALLGSEIYNRGQNRQNTGPTEFAGWCVPWARSKPTKASLQMLG